MTTQENTRTVVEPPREIKVCSEVDVLVVGGGPGGIGAAVSAARNGARTALIERYGHLGGMATGGLVNIIPNLGDMYGKQHIFGLTQEIVDRLDARGAASYPRKEDWGTTDKKVVDYYLDANFGWFYIRKDEGGQSRVLQTVVVDPEILKDELNTMVGDAGVELFLHSWGAAPIMDGNNVKGVIFESKSGRQAILARVVIDSTGDGDIFVRAGAPFDAHLDTALRTSQLAVVFWLANVDVERVDEFRRSCPDKYAALMEDLKSKGGHPFYFKGILESQKRCVWVHFFQTHPDRVACDPMDVRELTMMDVRARKRAVITYDFFRKNVPGFEKSFIMQTAPQLGTQGGRRVIGEYTLSEKDFESDEVFEDTIVALANNDNGSISAKHPTLCVPYRCLVPKETDGLLVACRGFSSSDRINHQFNIIPHCLSYGQAAGTAAALAAREDIQPRRVDHEALCRNLSKQGVWLPQIKP
jgi:2-polyprenyl-6-methoxyphenol hydroxylase-like FAD-dependent oxidoreductase